MPKGDMEAEQLEFSYVAAGVQNDTILKNVLSLVWYDRILSIRTYLPIWHSGYISRYLLKINENISLQRLLHECSVKV